MAERKHIDPFAVNYYLSDEWLEFCAEVVAKNARREKGLPLVGKKNVAIHCYDKEQQRWMRSQGIEHSVMTTEDNYATDDPALMEIPILSRRSYEDAWKGYSKMQRRAVRRFRNEFEFERHDALDDVGELYMLYRGHMRRVNGAVFSKEYFELFNRLESSFFLLIRKEGDLVAYSCCMANDENMYASIGGADQRFFDGFINEILLDAEVREACRREVHLHMGLGMHDHGASKFKLKSGATAYGVRSVPDHSKLLRSPQWMLWLLQGTIRVASRLAPHKVTYMMMPFT